MRSFSRVKFSGIEIFLSGSFPTITYVTNPLDYTLLQAENLSGTAVVFCIGTVS